MSYGYSEDADADRDLHESHLEISRLTRALQFYARHKSWDTQHEEVWVRDPECFERRELEPWTEAGRDQGGVAREALHGCGEADCRSCKGAFDD